jgi:hypothetical protein
MKVLLVLSSLIASVAVSFGVRAAEKPTFVGPFYKCPDAHGADQKARFKKIDISGMPMTIEGKGSLAVAGDNAEAQESISPAGADDPIAVSIGKWSTMAQAMHADVDHRTVSVCFATKTSSKQG